MHHPISSPAVSKRRPGQLAVCLVITLLVTLLSGCGDGSDSAEGSAAKDDAKGSSEGKASSTSSGRPGATGGRPSGGGPPGGGRPGGPGGGAPPPERGVPVQVHEVQRQDIAAYFATQGILEAENEVDLIARVAGPVVQLSVEEGDRVRRGQLLAKLDDRELQAELSVVQVRVDETQRAYERVKALHESQLVSQEAIDQSLTAMQSAQGDHERIRLQLDYTRINAPFGGLIVERHIKLAEHVNVGSQLFRLSDFDPLLCPIQVPERELRRLRPGQEAEIVVEAWGERRFAAKVLRVAPVIDAASGTVKVTLEVNGTDGGQQVLDPGMFASVYLEMETRAQAVALPRTALSLDSLGDSVFVVRDGVAQRQVVQLGLRNDRYLEVLEGLEAGDQVIVVGQDGLSDGTPVDVVRGAEESPAVEGGNGSDRGDTLEGPGEAREPGERGGRGKGGGPFADLDLDNPEDVERIKGMMQQRGLSEAEIDERLERMRQRRAETPTGGGA